MKLTILGTGNAMVTECYNTCFALQDNDQCFLVDAGGGSTILHQLKAASINIKDIRYMFVTHKHIDHLLGVIWIIRAVAQEMTKGKYEGQLDIYAHDEVIGLIMDIAPKLIQEKQAKMIGSRIRLNEVKDGDYFEVIGHKCQAFDIKSTKAKQYGFTMYYGNDRKFTCCGDEPYNECEYQYAAGSEWLLHEAFCLHQDADIFKPYEKHHSTAKDASELAESLNVRNLILYHTEDTGLANRKERYTAEGKQYFSGNLWVPDDLETFDIL